jgi:hypothetical protein
LAKGQFSILININHYLKIKCDWHMQRMQKRVGDICAFRAVREASLVAKH